jgi:hypothetical protein
MICPGKKAPEQGAQTKAENKSCYTYVHLWNVEKNFGNYIHSFAEHKSRLRIKITAGQNIVFKIGF